MLLLTGATGTVGLPLLRRLTAAGVPTRCLVRDPRRLGAERVRVQIALGDLAAPPSFRHALHGIDTEGARYELAGPDTLTYEEIVEIALRSFGRRRPIVPKSMRAVLGVR